MSAGANAGYSGKPAWCKLGLTPNARVRVLDAPGDYATLVGAEPGSIAPVGARAGYDLAHVFAVSAAKLAAEVLALSKTLPADGVIWVSWPKKASKVATDVTEDTVRAVALPLGLVDVKVCAIDAVWSGLKLVWRRTERAKKA
ncbi:DUF3052 domain-containing protein [Dokdonella ginsengisoli]|uniref:DUF3052 domain-containing protein n=1 Tax=Dokdonella ginsengisoli TaxID=363846 RepID=A0ABV9QZA6_9GAMM